MLACVIGVLARGIRDLANDVCASPRGDDGVAWGDCPVAEGDDGVAWGLCAGAGRVCGVVRSCRTISRGISAVASSLCALKRQARRVSREPGGWASRLGWRRCGLAREISVNRGRFRDAAARARWLGERAWGLRDRARGWRGVARGWGDQSRGSHVGRAGSIHVSDASLKGCGDFSRRMTLDSVRSTRRAQRKRKTKEMNRGLRG